MSSRLETEIERDALKIPANARLRLAAKLLASVPGASRPSLNEKQALDLAAGRVAELDDDVSVASISEKKCNASETH